MILSTATSWDHNATPAAGHMRTLEGSKSQGPDMIGTSTSSRRGVEHSSDSGDMQEYMQLEAEDYSVAQAVARDFIACVSSQGPSAGSCAPSHIESEKSNPSATQLAQSVTRQTVAMRESFSAQVPEQVQSEAECYVVAEKVAKDFFSMAIQSPLRASPRSQTESEKTTSVVAQLIAREAIEPTVVQSRRAE